MYKEDHDFLLVTETWLNDKIPDSFIDPEGLFEIIRCDRVGYIGGGVCIAVRKSPSLVVVPVDSKVKNVELVAIDVLTHNYRLRLINAYRPPYSNESARLEADILYRELFKLCNVKWPCFIVGDLNCPHIKWALNYAPSDGIQDLLLRLVNEKKPYSTSKRAY